MRVSLFTRVTAMLISLICLLLPFSEAQTQSEDAGIYGRVWVNSTPSPDVQIAVYYADGGNSGYPIAATTSRGSSGPHSGNYSISGLPSGVRLRIETTYPTWPDDHGISFVTLVPGEARELNLSVDITSSPGPGHPSDPR